jgi:AraC family transcriptional regulator
LDWVTGIQKAVDYIEDNLLTDLKMDEIAKTAYSSVFQFQRVFHILSGFNVGEYIRNRRLSLAAADLQAGNGKIIDIAVKYGYETPESFSRAFERFHGVLPSAARKSGVNLKSFSRLSIKVILEGCSVMDYRIENLDSFSLLGKVEKQMISNVQAGKFWNRCKEDETLKILTALSTSPEKEHIGMADGSSYDGKSYLYYIATPYEGKTIPDGFVIKNMPARIWIKFRCISLCDKPSGEEIWRKIYSEFFPTSDYQPSGGLDFEVYPDGDIHSPRYRCEICISVEKK